MRNIKLKLIALFLVAALLLSGCGLIMLPRPFSRMEYIRPDVTALEQKLTAVEDLLPEAESADQIMRAFFDFYNAFLSFSTNYSLAYIHYCQDLTDIYWEEEYNYCLSHTTWLDASYNQLLYALADCSFAEELESENYFGPGFFDEFQGDSPWDDTLIALQEEESRLLSEYYALSAEEFDGTESYYEGTGLKIAEIYVEMIALRQEIAEHTGYADYPSFSYDFHHYRDYTPQQAQTYMDRIQQTLVPLYQQVASQDHTEYAWTESSEAQTLAYVERVAKKMGGNVEAAFNTMKQFDLYDIKASEKQYDASFELYLYAYQMPFVFVNSTGTNLDKLTLTHEFGHFCRDYLSYGAQQSLDVGEYFSQAMENLSLFYGTEGDAMRPLRLQQSLNVYVEQAAYASFEQQVYSLTGDDLTVENVDALFESTMASYGMDIWDIHKRDYVQIPHLFISPLYIISYIVSNDAALQIYQQEEKRAGAGLETYLQTLQTSQIRLMGFVEETGLESPFAPKRLETVRQTFEKALLSE